MGSHPYLRTKPINGITSLSTNQSHYWNHSHFYTITLLMGSQQYLQTYPINGITAISTDISPSMGSQQYLQTYPHQWDHSNIYRHIPINGITAISTYISPSMGSQSVLQVYRSEGIISISTKQSH
jgi:hypothetical protein